jgi:hypothetical protein
MASVAKAVLTAAQLQQRVVTTTAMKAEAMLLAALLMLTPVAVRHVVHVVLLK